MKINVSTKRKFFFSERMMMIIIMCIRKGKTASITILMKAKEQKKKFGEYAWCTGKELCDVFQFWFTTCIQSEYIKIKINISYIKTLLHSVTPSISAPVILPSTNIISLIHFIHPSLYSCCHCVEVLLCFLVFSLSLHFSFVPLVVSCPDTSVKPKGVKKRG